MALAYKRLILFTSRTTSIEVVLIMSTISLPEPAQGPACGE